MKSMRHSQTRTLRSERLGLLPSEGLPVTSSAKKHTRRLGKILLRESVKASLLGISGHFKAQTTCLARRVQLIFPWTRMSSMTKRKVVTGH